jgi:hypothetical protein
MYPNMPKSNCMCINILVARYEDNHFSESTNDDKYAIICYLGAVGKLLIKAMEMDSNGLKGTNKH